MREALASGLLPYLHCPGVKPHKRKAPMKIMIVDDNRQMRRMIVSLIDDLVEEIIECGDGSEAVPAYDEHRPDWVLMDIEMGRVDGIEATRQIRDAFPDARIVMVTNYDESELRAAASTAGACGYVLKDNLLGIREILTG